MCAISSFISSVCKLILDTTAQAKESPVARQYPAESSTNPSSGHSPSTFWTENSTPAPPAQVLFDFSSDMNDLMSLDDTWALFAESQWTGSGVQSLDSATGTGFSPLAPVQSSSPRSIQGIEMIQDEEDKVPAELAPPHVLDEL